MGVNESKTFDVWAVFTFDHVSTAPKQHAQMNHNNVRRAIPPLGPLKSLICSNIRFARHPGAEAHCPHEPAHQDRKADAPGGGMFLDNKVLNRQHTGDGKIYIKDVNSFNGTFINGERLSGERYEPDPSSSRAMISSIDIVGKDTNMIIHHKFAARIVCMFTEQDVQVASSAEQRPQRKQMHSGAGTGKGLHGQHPHIAEPGGVGGIRGMGVGGQPQV
ncbi:hypothetical protein CVT25_009839 [Psilocybe cyanescens]|uniref:FHA domain-containing protein n=1 Tax=Psilocybe cyanescens TaxID=93625 RepID=A0A409W4W9_PSICY|nr:hypothetical protein CVT25_009839 [Psilocybe cyanescens]